MDIYVKLAAIALQHGLTPELVLTAYNTLYRVDRLPNDEERKAQVELFAMIARYLRPLHSQHLQRLEACEDRICRCLCDFKKERAIRLQSDPEYVKCELEAQRVILHALAMSSLGIQKRQPPS